MFAVLQLSEPKNKLKRGRITSQRIALPSGGAFFVVSVEKSFGKIPWKKLEKSLGILRKDVLLPKGTLIPEGVNITAFSAQLFPRILLMNSAAEYIAKNKSDFIPGSLCIFDEMGIYLTYIERLMNCFSLIKIVTDKRAEYEGLSQQLLENYGLSLVISNKASACGDAVISHECRVPVWFNGTLFTNEKKHLMNTRAFSGSEICLPEFYEGLRPDNINKLLFASALYEKCGEKALANLTYENFGC